MSKREDSSTLYLYVREHIIKLLISGDYPPGAKLPTEYQLMKELDVGRATVRAALAQLEEEGVIYKKQGIGTFVNKREKKFSMVPFISLSFIVKKLGLRDKNEILEDISGKSTSDQLTKFWPKGTELQRLARLRYIDKTPVAIETNYFTKHIYDKLDSTKLTGVLSQNLLNSIDDTIVKVENSAIIRYATKQELDILKIKASEKVVEIALCVYTEKEELPVNYVNLVVPTHVLEYSLIG